MRILITLFPNTTGLYLGITIGLEGKLFLIGNFARTIVDELLDT